MRLLISDKISDSSFSLLRDNNIDFDYLPEITPDELLTLVSKYQALVVRSRTKVTKEVIGSGINLKAIGRAGSGVDNIDIEAAREKNIIVVNAPDANSTAVAELTVGLMLSLLRMIPQAVSSMDKGLWLKKELSGSELNGKMVGILGYGHVGSRVGKIVSAFWAKVIIHSRSYQTVDYKELFKLSDIVTIHLALNKDTRGCVTKDILELMKPTTILINTSRGEIIDEEALYKHLSEKKIAGAALDVYWQEPLPPDSRWRKLDNVILTPHIAASTKEALSRASITVVEDVVRVLKGERPKNGV